MRAEEGSEEKMKEKRTFCNHTMRQKNQRCTVGLKEHNALRYRKDKVASLHRKGKGALRYRKDKGAL